MSEFKEPGVVFRVNLDPILGHVDVMTVGLVGVETEDPMEGTYKCMGDLPMWMQEKLAVLSILVPPDGPIEGIGRRIDRNVFWIFP